MNLCIFSHVTWRIADVYWFCCYGTSTCFLFLCVSLKLTDCPSRVFFPQHSVLRPYLFCFQLQNTRWTHSFNMSTPIRLMREYYAEKWAVGIWLLISQLYYDYTWLSNAFELRYNIKMRIYAISGNKTINIVNNNKL